MDGEYARNGTYSRVWSVPTWVGSLPWSAVIINKSSSFRLSSKDGGDADEPVAPHGGVSHRQRHDQIECLLPHSSGGPRHGARSGDAVSAAISVLIVEDKAEFREDFARMVEAAEDLSLTGTAETLAGGLALLDGPLLPCPPAQSAQGQLPLRL